MQIRAVRTFNSKDYGLIRDGMVVTVSDRYGKQVVKSGLAEEHVPDNAGDPVPRDDKSLPGPDHRKGDEGNGERDAGTDDSSRPIEEKSSEPAQESGATDSSSAARRGGGRKKRSSSRRQGPR